MSSPAAGRPEEKSAAEAYRVSQFQPGHARGHLWPEWVDRRISGHHWRQLLPAQSVVYNLKGFVHFRKFTPVAAGTHPIGRSRDSRGVYQRYHRPVFVAETGAENRPRAGGCAMCARKAKRQLTTGVNAHGICLYPILNHPGCSTTGHCHNEPLGLPDARPPA